VGERDLAGHDRVVTRHVCGLVVETVLQLHFHTFTELFDVEGRRVLVDAGFGAHSPGFVSGEVRRCSHRSLLFT
jgi:hypothetical protein